MNVTTGDGSDVVWIAGNTHSVVTLGAGDDFAVAEGNAILYGGAGDDTLFGNTVDGGAGNDQLFSTGFASGGAGDDVITLFSLKGDGSTALTGYGGDGADTILADDVATVYGGAGDDSIILRKGGTAYGGDGSDVITAEADATIYAGDGTKDIQLIAGGKVVRRQGQGPRSRPRSSRR